MFKKMNGLATLYVMLGLKRKLRKFSEAFEFLKERIQGSAASSTMNRKG
jgi:hypothetical protein